MPNKLARYVEWQSGGRRTGRVAYVIGKQHLPEPIAGAEWQIDSKFNVSEEILRDPTIEAAFKAAIATPMMVARKGDSRVMPGYSCKAQPSRRYLRTPQKIG